MVPASAINHGVLISSAYLRARHDLSQAEFSDGVPIPRNASAAMCDGGRKALPLQNMEVTDAVELRCDHCFLESRIAQQHGRGVHYEALGSGCHPVNHSLFVVSPSGPYMRMLLSLQSSYPALRLCDSLVYPPLRILSVILFKP